MSHLTARIRVINISDRAAQGIYEDIPGKACVELLKECEQRWPLVPPHRFAGGNGKLKFVL